MAKWHDCRLFSVKREATPTSPYQFVGYGLPNVLLVGIEYSLCSVCGRQTADIPAIGELLSAIARAIVHKPRPLTGAEIRFLRTQMGMKAADFAAMIGVVRENVSRWENGHKDPQESADRLIRITYSVISGDKDLKSLVEQHHFQRWITSIQGTGSEGSIVAKRAQNEDWWCVAADRFSGAAASSEQFMPGQHAPERRI